jgi:hypothetical protein
MARSGLGHELPKRLSGARPDDLAIEQALASVLSPEMETQPIAPFGPEARVAAAEPPAAHVRAARIALEKLPSIDRKMDPVLLD